MAVTKTRNSVRLGAVGDALTLESFDAEITGVLFTTGSAAGVLTLNDKADGSGASLADVYLKSNMSLFVGPLKGVFASGGFKANASNPAGSVVLVYVK